MSKRIDVFVVLLLMLTIAACSKKSTNTSENQPANAASQQAATNPPAPPAATPATPAPAPAPPAATPPPAAPPVEAKKAPPPPPTPVVLPAGTTLTVQVAQAIDTKTAKQGDVFTGSTASPISAQGKVVVPKGAHVEGVVVQSQSPGRFKGAGALSVKLTKLTVKGASYHIDTAPDTLTVQGKGKRTAVLAGGGTAGGALIGGLAGGGKGAAIGALLGAGAGGAGAGLTGNKELVIPAESALSFRLRQAVTLRPQEGTDTRASGSTE